MRLLMRLLVPLALLFTIVGGVRAQDRSFVWERIESSVELRANGTLNVTERLTLRYTGGPFTFAFRDLPDRRLDEIREITVADDQQAYRRVEDEESSEPYTYSVFREDGEQRVRWVYPPTSDTSRSFTLRYEVAGAVRRFADYDEIWWSMVFPDREEIVLSAVGTISLPQPVPSNQLSAEAPDVPSSGGVVVEPGRAGVQATNIAPDEELTLRLRFPKGIAGGAPPEWQAGADWQDTYNVTTRPAVNVGLSLLAVLTAAGSSAGAWLWSRRRRDPEVVFDGPQYDPPDSLRPAEVARLLQEGENQAFLATVFDLANRGFLTLQEEQSSWRNWVTRVVRVHGNHGPLATFEQRVLDALFDEDDDDIVLSGTNDKITKALPEVGEAAEQELIALGLVAPARRDVRKQAYTIGGSMLGVGIVALIGSFFFAEMLSYWLPVVAGAIALGGVVWMFAGGSVRGLTQQGAEAAARWRAFKQHLDQFDRERATAGEFNRLLPYAVAIGDINKLTRSYAATSEPLPFWYYPHVATRSMQSTAGGSGGDSGLMLQDFSQNFLSAISTANQSTSSSSSSSSSSSGASGGGGGGAG